MAGSGLKLAAHDREVSRQGALRIAGVDEAGRGCWAGPVVAAAVILAPGPLPAGLDDSKRLTPARREIICEEIMASASIWGACAVDARRIDELDILRATLLAMRRAVGRLNPAPDLVLVDGLQAPEVAVPVRTLVRGDGTSAAVAAASVVAKVLRDRVMRAWDRRYPAYGFAAHKGYGVAAHREALRRHGPCPLHRLSYRPLAELDQGDLF